MGAVQPGTRPAIDAGPITTEPIGWFGKPERSRPFPGQKGHQEQPLTENPKVENTTVENALRTSIFSLKFSDIFQHAPILLRKLNANPVMPFRFATPFYRTLDN